MNHCKQIRHKEQYFFSNVFMLQTYHLGVGSRGQSSGMFWMDFLTVLA